MQPVAVQNLIGNTPQQAAGVLTLKLLAGDVTAIPTATVLRATVTAVADGKAEVTLNGQPVTVRAQPALTPGTELAVRVTPSGIEAVVIPPTPIANPNPTAPNPAAPAAPVVVAQAKPSPATPAILAQVATFAAAPVALAPVESRPATAAPRTADGTVSPTSAPVAAQNRPTTAIAPVPPPPAPPLAVAPNVPVRTPTPPIPLLPGQAPPVPAPKPRAGQRESVTSSSPAVSERAAPPQTATATRIPVVVPSVPQKTVAPPQLSVVEVLPPTRDGVPQVRVDGRAAVPAESSEPLTPGAKVIAQVVRTPQGVRIIPAPVADTPQVTTAVVAAILKQGRPPPVGVALPKLVRELEQLPPSLAAKPTVVRAATELREAVRTLLPDTPRPPTADELRTLVENGGQRYEAKLARQTEGGDGPGPQDLKGGLLKLFEAVPALAHSQLPAAKATLDSIEQQQASNVLSQQSGGPLVLQVPFPDGPHWRTLHLAIEPEQPDRDPAETGTPPFRMLMHVPLSDLGDTWIDAGLNGGQFRAVLYLEQAAVRDRVRGELPALQSDLKLSGFTDVLLDVRSTADLTDRQRQRGAAMTAGVPVSTSVIDARA